MYIPKGTEYYPFSHSGPNRILFLPIVATLAGIISWQACLRKTKHIHPCFVARRCLYFS